MNDFKKRMKAKIKLYSNEDYLDGYIKNEYLSENQSADIYLNIRDKDELFDSRTTESQLDLRPEVYEYIARKSSMLENDTKLVFHIVGIKLTNKEKERVRHIINEHFAIELYKKQKEYVECRNKLIWLLSFGLLTFISYFLIFNYVESNFLVEVFGFLFSFSLWEALDLLLYDFADLKYDREAITQDLLMDVSFDKDSN